MSAPPRLRTLVVDDEPHARRLLRALLAAHPAIDVVGEAADGVAAKTAIDRGGVDLVFLDVQMPGMSGLDLIEAVGPAHMPAVVFVTAHDRYAVRAFELHALDYLLKPYDERRLAAAVARATLGAPGGGPGAGGDQLRSMVEQLRARREYPARIAVRTPERIVLVELHDVSWIEADDKQLRLHVGATTLTTRGSLRTLEAQLDPTRFVRIQRSLMVNAAHVRELLPWSQHEHVVVLRDGTRLVSGRTYRDNVLAILKSAALGLG